MKIVKGIPPKLPLNTYVAFDSEMYRMNKKTLHRPTTGKFAMLTLCYQPGEVWYVDDEKDVPAMLDTMEDAVWLIHNAKFDITQMRRYATIPPRTKMVDTMLMERILWNGYYDDFGEQALARRYLHEHMDKSLQKAWGDVDAYTPEMLEYACRDSETLLRIWYEQKKHITKTDMQVYKEIDLPALWAVLDFQGFRVDSERWLELSKYHRQLSDEIDAELPVNPRSSQQVVPYLRKHGFKTLKSSLEKNIIEAVRKYPNAECIPVAQKILDSRGYRKMSSNYGQNMLNNFGEEVNGCVYFFGDNHITGAITGRMSCSNPNLDNIPVRETPVFRECFIASPGNDLVVGDWSQQEVFNMAFLSQDQALLDVCNSGKDIYIQMAKVIYDRVITKKDPLRKDMKTIVLAINYGGSKYGLARSTGKSLDDAEGFINDFFRTFPGVKMWMNNQDRIKTYTLTVSGRKGWLNPYTDKAQRNAYNNPIQGTAADSMKMCMGIMHRNWKFDYPFGCVASVYDELVLDVPKPISKDVAEFTKFHMEDVANKMLPGMKFRADVSIGSSWAVKE